MKKIMAIGMASLLFTACTGDSKDRQQPTDKEEQGRIIIPTTSISSSGNMYMLSIDHMHLSSDTQEYDLSFEASPFEEQELEVTLRADMWSAHLVEHSLYLYDPASGELDYVESFVESQNPQYVEIFPRETSIAYYRIRTIDDVVDFDEGDLAFVFEVDDSSSYQDADGDG